MKLAFEVAGQAYATDTAQAVSIGIPLRFGGAQPRFFGAAPASARALRSGSWEGATRRGGSCNVSEIAFTPHCNGTHTETAAHIVNQYLAPHRVAPLLCPATLVSLTPVSAGSSLDSYTPALRAEQRVIDRALLDSQLAAVANVWLEALVVRTLPNPDSKLSANYDAGEQPAFFTREAMHYLRERGVAHLLVDLPSLDHTHDEGHLTAHHVFFEVHEASRELPPDYSVVRSVTELCFVPDTLVDGPYLLNLQLPPFELDAAPARPLLLGVETR